MIITQDLSYHYSYGNYMMSEYFNNTVIEEIKKYAGNVFKFLGMENYGRIDCRVTPNGEFYLMTTLQCHTLHIIVKCFICLEVITFHKENYLMLFLIRP